MPTRAISASQFETYVQEALAEVPSAFRRYLENVVVMVEDEPSARDLTETDTHDDRELFGVFRGIPYFERGSVASHLPAQIVIFRGPILRHSSTRRQAVQEVRDTVVHEIGHMLGLSDDEMPY